jgi:hypothetical protein
VFAASQTVNGTITATSFVGNGSGLTNVTNASELGGFPPSSFAQLATNNRFTGNQAITGNLVVSGTVSAGTVNAVSGFYLGGAVFAFGSQANENAFLGFAGNPYTTGTFNTASGLVALVSNTSGGYNMASGAGALYSNTNGSANTASGFYALFSNTTGGVNTASGDQALVNNTIGSGNTASGVVALGSNTTGYQNTASGYSALTSSTTGNYNTASGGSALGSNTTGSNNVGVGYLAGVTADHSGGAGSNDIAVGAYTEFGTGSITNATAIGANAEVTESNTMVLGCIAGVNNCQTSVSVGIGTTTPDNLLSVNGSADKPGGGSWGTYSDGRLKTVNGSFDSGLNQVMKLHPIRYRYKPDNALSIRDADEHVGVVAQEVQRVIPEAVTENGKGYLLVNNDPIIWSMVNAIKEQQREIERQQKLLLAQSAVNEEQQKLLRAQGSELRRLQAEVRETRKTLDRVKARAAAAKLSIVASN